MTDKSSKIATFSFDDGGPGDVQVINLFNRLSVPATFYLISAYFNDPVMAYNPDETKIRDLYRSVEVGSHTVSHPHLSLSNADKTRYELDESKAVLARVLDKTITLFAYPFGSGSKVDLTKTQLRASGYKWARCIQRSWEIEPGHSKFNMPIDCVFYSSKDELIFQDRIQRGVPIHVMGHPYWIDRSQMLCTLNEWVTRLLGAGYKLLSNTEFFEATSSGIAHC